MTSLSNLMACPVARSQRRLTKRFATLRFLRQQLWSTQEILQEVMSLQSRQATHKTLTQMESEHLLRRYTIQALGGPITLWGITAHGQAMAFLPETERLIPSYFEPSKVSEQNIRHQLDLQKLRIKAEAAGWASWCDGDRIGTVGADNKRPDAIATDPQGRITAVECERTMKTAKRYEAILVSYLRALKAQQISRVIWVCPTPEITLRLKTILLGIKSVRVAGERVAIDSERHHRNLFFVDYGGWPNV